MWSYMMAAARGDPRRRPGSVFTVQSQSASAANAHAHSASQQLRRMRAHTASGRTDGGGVLNANAVASADSVVSFPRDSGGLNSVLNKYNSRDLLTNYRDDYSRESAKDSLSEVRVQSPPSEDEAEKLDQKLGQTGNLEESSNADGSGNRLMGRVRGRMRRVASSLRAAIRLRRFSRRGQRGKDVAHDWFVDRNDPAAPADADKGKTNAGTESAATRHPFCCWTQCWNSSRLVIDPTLSIHYKWLMIVSLAVLYNVIFVVGRAVFWELNNSAQSLWWSMDTICDAVYLMDVIVRAHEGYLEHGLLVTDPSKLRHNYMRMHKWRLDVLSLLPTDVTYLWWAPNSCSSARLPCAVLVRLNRLVKLPRVWEWFERTETDTNYPNVFRICKVVLAILVLIHWNACLYFVISYAIGFGSDNWVYNNTGDNNATLTRQYIYSFYWSTLTLTTIGETPVPENEAEYLFVVADFLAGVLIFATIVGNIGSMISNMNVARVDFQNRMDGVKQYMAFRKVGRELEGRVIRWFAYTWAESGALDEERVLSALPDKLKAEIAIRVHLETLRKVRIFQDCEPGLLEALVLKLRLQVFSPGDYICRKGDVGKEMYIVKRGRLQVVADDERTVFATLGAGSVFGEVSVLDIAGNRTGNRRTANVRSLGYSDLFCLAKDDLWIALSDYPEAKETLIKKGCQLLIKDGLLDEEIFQRARDNQENMSDSIRKLEDQVGMLQTRLGRLLAEFSASQAKLKQRLTRVELRSDDMDSNQEDMECAGNLAVPRLGRRRRLHSFEAKRHSADSDSRHKTM